jgi:hypothetical protein
MGGSGESDHGPQAFGDFLLPVSFLCFGRLVSDEDRPFDLKLDHDHGGLR